MSGFLALVLASFTRSDRATLADPAASDWETHLRRWKSRVSRTKDLNRLRFGENGVHLANNIMIPWHYPKRPTWAPIATAVRDVVASGDGLGDALIETMAQRGLVPEAWLLGIGKRIVADDALVSWVNSNYHDDSNWAEWAMPDDAELVSVAQLGVDEIVRQTRLATELTKCPTRVAWRPMNKLSIDHHHRKACLAARERNPSSLLWAFSGEESFRILSRGQVVAPQRMPWSSVACPWGYDHIPEVVEAWPVLRAIATLPPCEGVENMPSGVHLIDLRVTETPVGDRVEKRAVVTLAVERIG